MLNRNDNYILRKISDVPLLICSRKPINDIWLFELNAVGCILWENCVNVHSYEELYEKIQPYFAEKLSSQQRIIIKDFIRKLVNMGLIEEDV